MEKAGTRTRDIQFWSEKNQRMVCVHSRQARDFAKHLERQSWVERYETCVPLEARKFQHINPVDIRKAYFSTAWTTDFLIHTSDGHVEARELVDYQNFVKKAVIEKLELSRRYWAALDVSNWKLLIYGSRIERQKEES